MLTTRMIQAFLLLYFLFTPSLPWSQSPPAHLAKPQGVFRPAEKRSPSSVSWVSFSVADAWDTSLGRRPEGIYITSSASTQRTSSSSTLGFSWVTHLEGSGQPPCGGNSFRLLVYAVLWCFRSLPKAHDHRRGQERRSTGTPKTVPTATTSLQTPHQSACKFHAPSFCQLRTRS